MRDIRIGDAEREEALHALGTHLSAGRLDIDEYGDRSAKVTAARTRGELVSPFADLPEPRPAFGSPALAAPATLAKRPGWRGIPPGFTGPIIGVAWVSAIFIGPALRLDWMFGVAIAVTIILGSLTRTRVPDGGDELPEARRDQRRMVRDEMPEWRREDQ